MSRRLIKVDDAEVVEVGRVYLVPTIDVDNLWGVKRIPVLGPLHWDKEIIGFPDEHWHLDWRFAQDSLTEGPSLHGRVLSKRNAIGVPDYKRWKVYSHRA